MNLSQKNNKEYKKDLNNNTNDKGLMNKIASLIKTLLNYYIIIMAILIILMVLPISSIVVVRISYDGDKMGISTFQKKVSILSYFSVYSDFRGYDRGDTRLNMSIEKDGKIWRKYDDLLTDISREGFYPLYYSQYQIISHKAKNDYVIIKVEGIEKEVRIKIA